MYRQINKNKGFTLIELLISMALLSIITLMVVQFMSSTAGANRRTQYNLKAQTVANEVITNISNSLMQAEYVKVVPADDVYYALDNTTGNRIKSLSTNATAPEPLPADCHLVPDNYGNYAQDTSSVTASERKVIVDMDNYQLPGEKNGDIYPISGDLEDDTFDARSFRILKQDIGGTDTYLYIEPAYIYLEYTTLASTGAQNLCNIIYRFDGNNIYMYRSSENTDLGRNTKNRFETAKSKVDSLSRTEGLLTEYMTDFYLSADVEGNSLMLNSLFDVNGYMFNSATTVKFRNSQVLTVRPQNLYKKDNTSGSGGSGGGTGGGGTGGGVEPPPTSETTP